MPIVDEILEVEAFRSGMNVAGSGFSHEYSDADLDEILESVSSANPAPVVLGHPSHDAPAYGWIESGRKSFPTRRSSDLNAVGSL